MIKIFIYCTRHYTPTSNGLVERLNYELRKRIKAGLVKHNSLEWVDHLPEYLNSINNSKSLTTGFTPNELWSPGYRPTRRDQLVHFDIRPTDNSSKADIIKYVEAKLYRSDMQGYNASKRVYLYSESRDPDRSTIQ